MPTDIASLIVEAKGKGIKEVNQELNKLGVNSKKAANDVKDFEKSSERADSKAQKLAGTIKGKLGVAVAGLVTSFGIMKAINIGDTFDNLEARIGNSTRSIIEAQEAMRGLSAISLELGTNLADSVDVFQRLAFSRDEIGATVDEMVAFTSTVQKLGVVSGASTGALSAGLLQLGQGLSAGVLRAEEFNSILENIPAVGKAIADEFGVTVGQLRALVLDGQVLSQDVFAAILNQSAKANEQFEKMPLTFERAKNQLGNAVDQLIAMLTGASNLNNLLANFVSKITAAVKALNATFRIAIFGIENLIRAATAGILEAINIGIRALNRYGEAVADVYNAISNTINKTTLGKVDIGQRQSRNIPEIGGGGIGRSAQDLIRQDYNNLAGEINALFPAEQAAGAVTKELSKNYAELAKNIKDSAEATKEKGKAGARTGAILEDMSQSTKRLESAMDDLGKSTSNAFEKMIVDGQSARDTMLSIVTDIQRALYQATIGQGIENLIGGLFNGGSKTSDGIPIPQRKPSSSGFSFGNILGSVGSLLGFANEGQFKVGGSGGTDSQLVAFRASPQETVSITRPDRDNLSGGGGSGTIVYNIDARGADAGAERRIIQSIKALDKSIERRALNAVETQNKRNPNYGRR